MLKTMRLHAAAAALCALTLGSGIASAQIMIVGNDQKPGWDKEGNAVLNPGGHDTLSIIDMSKPEALRVVATIPLDNSIAGPPTNLAITPSHDLALVANSVKSVEKDGKPANATDNRLFVVDLKANPPAVISTLQLGKRPSGLAINAAGTLALVTNRGDGTISVLSIHGKDVKVVDTVTVGTPADQVAAVAITPDGKRALVAKPAANKIAVLAIDGDKVSYDKHDLPAGIFPYNVVIAPDGKLALTADNGNHGTSDGNVDTVSVIDLEAKPIRVINHITVGDSTEGLAISPDGKFAASIEARGSNKPASVWYHHPTGAVTVLRIDGKKVSRIGEVNVGRLPEGGVFSPDSKYLYVGNFIDKNLSVLQVSDSGMREVGHVELPGQPASMRGGPQ
jgi:DNA-binding beta-propeller fold protein YncE